MKLARIGAVVIMLVGCGRDEPADTHAHPQGPAPAPAPAPVPAGNAVQNEMRLLTEAMRDTVTAIGVGDLSTIPHRLHEVHGARELTEKAIASGTYKLPRNDDQRPAFLALDAAFHTELEKLFVAARSNDAAATSAAFGTVMSRCDGCHATFRAPK